MAPELVTSQLSRLPQGAQLLDPMMGSGSFVIEAAKAGFSCIGIDSDPLAVLISSAAASTVSSDAAVTAAAAVIAAPRSRIRDLHLDDETRAFINYWFDPATQDKLASLAVAITDCDESVKDVLWCAFSRLIVTKTNGASRARDVSHSRPHVVRSEANIDPLERLQSSVHQVLRKRASLSLNERRNLTIARADARRLPLEDGVVDAVVTSPPYLTAIDYLRGHRLSLVWMGHSIASLRGLRGENIGSERGAERADHLNAAYTAAVEGLLPRNRERVVNRYLADLDQLVAELTRVLAPGGTMTFVVANSSHSGTAVRIDEAITHLGSDHGLQEQERLLRVLPNRSRYLPPPTNGSESLDRRMRSETILTFKKSGHGHRMELAVSSSSM